MSAPQNDVQAKELYWSAQKINVECPHCLHTPCDFNCVPMINAPVPNQAYSKHQQALRCGKARAMWKREKKINAAAKARSFRSLAVVEPPIPVCPVASCTVHPNCVVNEEDQSDTEDKYCFPDTASESDSSSGYSSSSDESVVCKRKINRAEVNDAECFAKRNGAGSRRGSRDTLVNTCLVCLSNTDPHCGEIIHYSGCPNVKVEHHGWTNEQCYCGTMNCQEMVQRCHRKAVIKFQTEHFGKCSYYNDE